MRNFTDQEIIERVEGLHTFQGWKVGIYDVWIRSKADNYNVFDDKVFSYKVITEGERPSFIVGSANTGTTNAGSYGLLNFRFWNKKGCAILASDTIVYASHAYGLHKGKPAYVQVRSFPHYRDLNKDQKADETGEIHTAVIGANCHRAGTASIFINNWSVGCLVRNHLDQFLNWLDMLKREGYPKLHVAILKEW